MIPTSKLSLKVLLLAISSTKGLPVGSLGLEILTLLVNTTGVTTLAFIFAVIWKITLSPTAI